MRGNGWIESTVDDIKANEPSALATGPFGSAISSRHFTGSGVPVIRGSNLTQDVGTRLIDEGLVFISPEKAKEFRRSIARRGDLVFTCWGTIDQVGLIDARSRYEEYVVSNKQMKLTPDPGKADSLFLYYLFSSPEMRAQIISERIGSSVPGFNLGQLRAFRFRRPTLGEQKAIARILGTLDDKIELNRRMNETLEGMARALFKSWFIDFDPVRAKLDGRPPPGLDPATAALFPEHFEHTDIGLIPQGWTIKRIADVAKLNGATLGKNDELQQILYIEISEVTRGDVNKLQTYFRGEEPSRARRRLRHGDTALSTVRPERGAYFLALNPPSNLIGSTGFAVVSPAAAPWSFVHAALTQPEVFEQLGHLADGGAYPAVRPDVVGALELVWPDRASVIEGFHIVCGPLYERADCNRNQSRTLAAFRDALLPKLLSGEIRVRAAEKLVEEVA